MSSFINNHKPFGVMQKIYLHNYILYYLLLTSFMMSLELLISFLSPSSTSPLQAGLQYGSRQKCFPASYTSLVQILWLGDREWQIALPKQPGNGKAPAATGEERDEVAVLWRILMRFSKMEQLTWGNLWGRWNLKKLLGCYFMSWLL